ncbi:MAG: hypothetical protein IT425_07560 [Pirellulales bacterium]|nr:hypothetical protein [Pirellulales bacterium]
MTISAYAQNRGGTSAFGSSGFGSSGMGRSSFGSSGFGSSGFGSSGFGSSGFGRSGFGSSGFGNQSGFGSSGMGGFGNNQMGNQTFVGRDAGDMQTTFGQTSRASDQFFTNMNRQMARNNRQNRKQAKSSSSVENATQVMRTQVRIAFPANQTTQNTVENTLNARLEKILTDHNMSRPHVEMEGDTAVLSGAVASTEESQVIATLVSLEPGVRAVRNEMTPLPSLNVDRLPTPGE